MDASVVDGITDVVRNGKRGGGFAFNSPGDYACGAPSVSVLIPRIMAAIPELCSKAVRQQPRPDPDVAAMMRRGEIARLRAIDRIGHHRRRGYGMRVAKIANKPCIECWPSVFSGGKVPDKVLLGWWRLGTAGADQGPAGRDAPPSSGCMERW